MEKYQTKCGFVFVLYIFHTGGDGGEKGRLEWQGVSGVCWSVGGKGRKGTGEKYGGGRIS